MSTCYWCTPGGPVAIQLIRSFASSTLPPKEFEAASDDLCYCQECVEEYHKARDEVPSLHEVLWELETARLITQFEKFMKEDDDLILVEEDRETPLCCYTVSDFEKNLRMPLLEILKYPYLLLHERLSELCVEALCKMEQINYPYQVTGKHPGIYLLMVHPNEVIRRWAIMTARDLGKVDRDDYYDIQEVLTCLFKVIELGLFENPDIYNSSVFEKGRLILLPSHLYDTTNHKNYWLGICMLLTVLEEQAMDSLLLGPDKQNDFMQSIMNTMKKQADDERNDPFWPALHCFMVILDKLGSKVWGQLIDPIQAFQTIINNASYNKEIESIRQSCRRTKSEPLSDYGDEMITCSQIVYNYHPEKPHKDVGRRTAVCPDFCPNLYEDMQTLTDMFQSDIGQDMRLHNSTFLWFIPFVHSLMDLKDIGVAYGVEIIRHLCSEIKVVPSDPFQPCDKVSEFFIWILVTVVDLSMKRNCLRSLWVSSEKWVEAVVKGATLPSTALVRGVERGVTRSCPRSVLAASSSWEPGSVQAACMNLIRYILKEGYQVGQKASLFLDELNLLRRSREDWKLSPRQALELQACLKQIIKCKSSLPSLPAGCVSPPSLSVKQEQPEDRGPANPRYKHLPHLSPRGRDEVFQEGSSPRRSCGLGEAQREASCKDPNLQTSACLLTNIKQESLTQESNNLSVNGHLDALKNGSSHQGLRDPSKGDSTSKSCFDQGFQNLETKDVNQEVENLRASKRLTENDRGVGNGSMAAEVKVGLNSLMHKIKSEKPDLTLKLKEFVENRRRGASTLGTAATGKQQPVNTGSRGLEGPKGDVAACGGGTSEVSLCKSEDTFRGKLLSVKKESKDRLAEFRSTLKAEPNSEGSSSDDDMANVPLSTVRQKLMKRRSAPARSPVTDSHIDRDLDKLSLSAHAKATDFPLDASPESTRGHQNRIKRKVQGAARSWSDSESDKSASDADEPRNQVIIISDTSSDEDENKVNVSRKGRKERTRRCPEKAPSGAQGQELVTASDSPLLYGECESQCFEFETEEDIFSAWQDSQVDEKAEEGPAVKVSSSPTPHDLEEARQINDWGYDTDYLGDDITEKAAEDLEQHVKGRENEARPPVPPEEGRVGKGNATVCSRSCPEVCADAGACPSRSDAVVPSTSVSPGPSAPKSPGEKSPVKPGKSLAKSQPAKAANKSPEKRSVKPNVHNKKSLPAKPATSTPFIVPPKKVHHFPEPTSTVEKLGLKKKIRRAAELSQRTQDSLAELRDYGKAAGKLSLPQKRKAKLIQPQNLVVRNKKLLASQERQFYKQSRERGQAPNGGNPGTRAEKISKKAAPKESVTSASTAGVKIRKEKADRVSSSSSSERKLLRQSSLEREAAQLAAMSQVKKEIPLTRQESTNSDANVQGIHTTVPDNLCPPVTGVRKTDSAVLPGSSSGLCHESVSPKASVSELNENVAGDGDSLFLTQTDPVDMELCSQIENGAIEENVPRSPLQDCHFGTETSKQAGCTEKVNEAGGDCGKRSAFDSLDHVFAKPMAPPKLSTTKIFSSSSSSRSANLTKELENVPKPPAVLKNKPNPGRPLASEGLKLRTPTLSSILRPQNLNPFAPSQNVQNHHGVGRVRTMPTLGGGSRQDARPSFAQANGINVQHRDHSIFIKEVLKWSYDMFANFGHLGAPNHLLQSIVASVPVRFQNYDDYFHVFFPLMMLNAFEEVASEWQEHQKAREPKPFRLNLLNFNADLNKADFTANVLESDLSKQLHPKDDDLVFLKVSEKRSYCEDGEAESRLVHHVGLVTRFSQPPVRNTNKKEQQVTCHLSIQTQGNLSRVDRQVQCVVASSLVSTQRRFRALLLLTRNPLVKPIISPSHADFCPKSLNVESEKSASYRREFNEDQRKAIETAYTMVTQEPAVPKICLIHGPPGTGKSRTIVGFLYRILSERSGKENPMQSLNAKIKRNRVLVCAPSNAAVDDLMKKIILEFKEKCQDRTSPLGNCGDINLVRLGQQKSISKDVRKFSLNDQIEHRMNKETLGKDQDLQKKKEELDRQLDMFSRQRAMDRNEKGEKKQQLDEEIGRLSKERQRLASQLKESRGRSQELKASIILESHIICCTLSTSGGLLLETAFRRLGGDPVSCIVVDEAGQTCEVETLIPLIHGCKKLVLVGDPKQLPPTVKSMKAQDFDYDQSLMGRLCKHLKAQVQENRTGRLPVLQLTTQYRMHPEICHFPSKYIYERALTTDRQTAETRFSLEWPFQPYLLFDVLDGREERESDSYANPQEVKLVMELMKLIKERRSDIGSRHIGIITPYSAQKKRIQKQLDKEFRENRPREVQGEMHASSSSSFVSSAEVDTVDGFQGREKDCIIVTCVRANSTQGSIGFLRSLQRLNVTITRAKYSLFILGKLKTLMENKDWNELIQDAQKRGNIIQTSSNSYKNCATKILKSRPLPRPGVEAAERDARGHAGAVRVERNKAPSRDLQRPLAGAGVPTPGSSAARPSPGPEEPSSRKLPPFPTQAKPVRERLQDPRLARRAESAVTTSGSKEAHLSASSGPPGPDVPPAQRSQSQAPRQLPATVETSCSPASNLLPQGVPLPARLHYAQVQDWRVSDGDRRSPPVRGNQDYHSWRRRASEEPLESQSPIKGKRRRTTY
ncbi:probable helicase senataxin [Elgaria multicarinata webbii]|uniref:probable helicase senataxin n=1 Tax=Elgaria multicarinata webbii TaxID=159646 RepID=UPI002FCD33BB